ALIGNVVDGATEAVNLEHGRTLLQWKNAQRRIERAAGRNRRGGRAGNRVLGPVQGHHVSPCLRARHLRIPLTSVMATAPAGAGSAPTCVKCTRSLRGSRRSSKDVSFCANATITAVSIPSRGSLTTRGSWAASGNSAATRVATEHKLALSPGDDLAAPSAST